VIDEGISLEFWWNDDDNGKSKYSEKMSQCHFDHHTSHIEWPEIRFPCDRLAINCLNHGAAHVL
jgi:hypothetical protein